MSSRVPAVTAGLFAVAFALDSGGLLAANECLDQPDQAAGQNAHWSYRIDRASGRKCWHLTEARPAARPQPEPPPQPAPEPDRQPLFSSFFSSLGFTTANVAPPQPDTQRDVRGTAIAQPEAAKGDDAASKRRQRADAKPAPVPKPDRQASSRPGKEVALDQAERDRLFQEFLRWRERQ